MLTDKNLIVQAQRELAAQGLYTGAIDGIAGKLTSAAVTKWQYLHGVPPTGVLSEYLVSKLEIPSLFLRQKDSPPNKKPKYPHDDTKSLTRYYGKPGDESKHTFIDLPYKMKLAWEPSTTVSRMRLHEKCANDFLNFFKDIASYYTPAQIAASGLDMFGGSYNNRAIRGGTRASTHAFACAVDLNPAENQLTWNKDRALFGRPEFKVLMEMGKANNLTNLGDKKGFDFMHFMAAWTD